MSFWEEAAQPVALDRRGRARREHAGLSAVVVLVVILALLIAGAYAAAHTAVGDKVARGTTISGVDVGGLTRAEAIARLEAAFAKRARTPIVFAAADASGSERTVSIRPDRVGLRIDAAASIDATDPSHSWRPSRLWDYFSGGGRRDAVVDVDPDALAARIRAMSGGFGGPPVNGRITFDRTGVHVHPGQAGDAVDFDDAVHAVETAYLSGATRARVAMLSAQPAIDHDDLTAALKGFAAPAMSAPVVLRFGHRTLRLTPATYASALSMVPVSGRLAPRIDDRRILAMVHSARTRIDPVDATVRLVGSRPRVVPGRPGLSFADDAVVRGFRSALTGRGHERTVTISARKAQPDFTTSDARELGVTKRVARFSTSFPASEGGRRLRAAVRRLDGRLVRPGQVLSLGSAAGPVSTAASGAAFFAGLADLTPEDPVVVDPGGSARGLRFRDDGRYGVLVQVATTPPAAGRPGRVAVTLWSTRTWTVTTRKGKHTDPVPPGVRESVARGCRPTKGVPGYTVAVTRIFRHVGKSAVDHTEHFHAVHAPVDRVVCR